MESSIGDSKLEEDWHWHSCPVCHDVFECLMGCSISLELDDPITYPGRKFGSPCACFVCQPIAGYDMFGRKIQTKTIKLYSQEWFEIYNGFKKKK